MDDLDNKSFFLSMLLLLIFLFIVISATTTNAYEKDDSSTKVMTTCRLASQILGNNQRVCVFLEQTIHNIESTFRMMQVYVLESINVRIDLMKSLLV